MATQVNSVSVQYTEEYTQKRGAQVWLLALIRGWGLVLLTLHLAASSLPADSAWSLWPYTFLPPWLGWLIALLAGSLAIARINEWLSNRLYQLWAAWPAKQAKQLWFAAAALLAGLIFWLARLRHLRWGDGYLLSVALSYPDLELRVIYNWQAPLTVFLHQRLWQFVADPLLGWPVETVYAAVSIICGMIFVYVLLLFTARLGRDAVESAVLAGLVLTTGSMQLFFGYVENYTIVSLALLCTLFLAWRASQGDAQPLWPVLGLSITNAFHPSTVFIWPGMWLLSYLCWRRGRVSLSTAIGQTVLPPLLIGGAVLALMESGGHGLSALTGVDRPGGGDGIWFVPLFETTTEWQQYTMFSAAHLIDWLNIHLLISPFGIPLIVLVLALAGWFGAPLFDKTADRDFAYYLGATSACYILFTWLWNADYGGRNDWDLFAPSAFAYTLLAGYLLVRALPDRSYLKEGGLFIVAVSLVHLIAWIFTNMHQLPHR